MLAHRGRVQAVMLGVEAAFDFISGTKPRAPAWLQKLGLEWLHRLASEPKRLWKRYSHDQYAVCHWRGAAVAVWEAVIAEAGGSCFAPLQHTSASTNLKCRIYLTFFLAAATLGGMSTILELSTAVRARRSDIGLTQTALAALSGLSRATVNQLEKGTIKDLSLTRAARLLEVLGLSMTIASPRPDIRPEKMQKGRALDIAARTASVSYRTSIGAAQLRDALITGEVPPALSPHVYALLDEAPVSLLASVAEQLHQEIGLERARVWKHMRDLARRLKSRREIWQ